MKLIAALASSIAILAISFPAHAQLSERYKYEQGNGDRQAACWKRIESMITHGAGIMGSFYNVSGNDVYSIAVGDNIEMCDARWVREGVLGQIYKDDSYKSLYEYKVEGSELCIYRQLTIGDRVQRDCWDRYQKQ